MKTKISRICKSVCFIALALVMIQFLTMLLTPKWLENRWHPSKTNKSFYELEENSIDVMFMGSSVMSSAVDPYQLYNDYGISSYNLSIMQQPMAGTYFWLKETLRTQKPSVIVVEVKTAGRVSDKNEADARKSYDYMQWGKNKLQYAIEYCNFTPEAVLSEYLFPIAKFHSRWSDLTQEDFDFVLGDDNTYTRGFATLTSKANIDMEPINEEAEYVEDKYNKTNESYLIRIIELCRENNIGVVLTKTPDPSWNGVKAKHVELLAKEQKVEYIDFNTEKMIKEINLDYANDGGDSVHLNLNGAKKVTDYLGKYLSENYEISDKRKDERISAIFDAEMEMYNQTYADATLRMTYNLDNYFKAIDKDYYSFVLANGENPVKIGKDMRKRLEKLGFSKSTLDALTVENTNVIEVVNAKQNVASTSEAVEDMMSHNENGIFQDGSVYNITSEPGDCVMKINREDSVSDDDQINLLVYNNITHEVADCVRFDVSEDGTVAIGRK